MIWWDAQAHEPVNSVGQRQRGKAAEHTNTVPSTAVGWSKHTWSFFGVEHDPPVLSVITELFLLESRPAISGASFLFADVRTSDPVPGQRESRLTRHTRVRATEDESRKR